MTAWTNANSNSAAIQGAMCHLFLGTVEIAATNLLRFGNDPEADRQMFTMSAWGSLGAASTAQSRCRRPRRKETSIGHGITAVQVGSLN